MRWFSRNAALPILLLAVALSAFIPAAFGQAGGTNDSSYVIIKLNNGDTREGPVLAEDEQQITINAQFAHGTITRRDIIDKADIATLTHLNQAERTQRMASMAYRALDKYQLDPKNSRPVSFYDRVILDVFKPFLSQYPNTPEAEQVSSRLSEWLTERAKVASGMVKRRGQWTTPDGSHATAELAKTNAPASPAEPQGVLEQMGDFLGKYWMYMCVGILVALWGVSRLFGKA